MPRDARACTEQTTLIARKLADVPITAAAHRGYLARAGAPRSPSELIHQVAYGRLVAAGAGIGFVARYNIRHWPGVEPILPALGIPPLPCWLAVHREIRGNKVVRRVYDFLAQAVPRELASGV